MPQIFDYYLIEFLGSKIHKFKIHRNCKQPRQVVSSESETDIFQQLIFYHFYVSFRGKAHIFINLDIDIVEEQ